MGFSSLGNCRVFHFRCFVVSSQFRFESVGGTTKVEVSSEISERNTLKKKLFRTDDRPSFLGVNNINFYETFRPGWSSFNIDTNGLFKQCLSQNFLTLPWDTINKTNLFIRSKTRTSWRCKLKNNRQWQSVLGRRSVVAALNADCSFEGLSD